MMIEFKKNHELFKVKQEEKNIKSQVASTEAGIRSLRSKINK